MDFDIVRVLRTPHSERFILRDKGVDFGALDIHFRPNGMADGTLILFDESRASEEQVAELLSQIDERMLPDVSVEKKSLAFTVVVGRVLGAFVPHGSAAAKVAPAASQSREARGDPLQR